MTIKFISGNILGSELQAVVIPVNTLGIAGAGLARQWAIRYPAEVRVYITACKDKRLKVGGILPVLSSVDDHIFLCFPTKIAPQNRSELIWIEDGLSELKRLVPHLRIQSLAVPALGCGLGGLSWNDVKPLIALHLGELKALIHIYPPSTNRHGATFSHR